MTAERKGDHKVMLTAETLQADNARYERKFTVTQLDRPQIEQIVLLHPGLFREIFYQRTVNNIYFDTANLADYWDNVCGSPHRLKVRVRWYGELLGAVEQPTLEFKIKSGFASWKKSYSLPSFSLSENFCFDDFLTATDQADLPLLVKETIKSRHPTLLNQYRRKYFLSASGRYRITIDTGMRYLRILPRDNLFLDGISGYSDIVVELKYVNGVSKLNHWHN